MDEEVRGVERGSGASAASGAPPRITSYFVASGALVAGAAVFVASQVTMLILTGGSLSFWGFALLFSVVMGITATLGMLVVGLAVLLFVRKGPAVPRTPRRQALLVGGLCAGIGVAILLVVQVTTGVLAFFVWSGLVGALAAGVGAARSVWNNRPGGVKHPGETLSDEDFLAPRPQL